MRTSYDSTAMSHLISNQQLLPHRHISQTILSPDAPHTNFNGCPPNNQYSTFPYSRKHHADSKERSSAFVFESHLTESQIGTCNGSMQSLTNEVPTNWQSNVTTHKNTGNHSPISLSNLPDSPSNLFSDNTNEVDQREFEDESCILTEAIEAVMPKPRQVSSPNSAPRFDNVDGECFR